MSQKYTFDWPKKSKKYSIIMSDLIDFFLKSPYFRVLFLLFRPKINVRYFWLSIFFLRKRGIIRCDLRGEEEGRAGRDVWVHSLSPSLPPKKSNFFVQIVFYYVFQKRKKNIGHFPKTNIIIGLKSRKTTR